MAADEYVKAAAAQLQNGAQAMKLQLDALRSELMTYQRESAHEIDAKTSEIRALSARLTTINDDPAGVAIQMQIQNLKKDIDQKKAEVKRRESDFKQQIQSKESTMSGLNSQASGLQSQAADPGLR